MGMIRPTGTPGERSAEIESVFSAPDPVFFARKSRSPRPEGGSDSDVVPNAVAVPPAVVTTIGGTLEDPSSTLGTKKHGLTS